MKSNMPPVCSPWLVVLFLLAVFSITNTKAQVNHGLNDITGSESSVTAGDTDANHGEDSLIGGGQYNTNNGDYCFIGGGQYNFVDVSDWSGIAGGQGNVLSNGNGNGDTDVYWTFIGGGTANGIYGSEYAMIGAGAENVIYYSGYSFIGGGYRNTITNVLDDIPCTIGGGWVNSISSNDGSTIAGGYGNTIKSAGAIRNSAYYSTIGGGYNNVVTGKTATVAGGDFNLAAGDMSGIPGGLEAKTTLFGQIAHASGSFDDTAEGRGQAQASEYVLRKTTTSTMATELLLSGDAATWGTQRLTLPANSTWTFDLSVVAREGNGNSGGFKTNGVIKNVSGTLSLNGVSGGSIGVPAIYSDVPGWSVTASADNVNQTLKITVTGDTATNRWVASIHTTEVIY